MTNIRVRVKSVKDNDIRGSVRRIEKQNYYLDIAETVARRGTCLRRNYGAIIVHNDEIVATGYTGAPRGRKNCCDLKFCVREQLNIPAGERYELCRSVHAEANCIISAQRRDTICATLYLVGIDAKSNCVVANSNCCAMCKRLIINSGIKCVIIRDSLHEYRTINVQEWVDNDDTIRTCVQAPYDTVNINFKGTVTDLNMQNYPRDGSCS